MFLLLACPLWAQPLAQPERPAKPPRLVLDAPPERRQPKCFRTSDQMARAYRGDGRGLASLQCSGSASFTRDELIQMQESFPGSAIVVDLRQESHALLNGLPVTWYAPSDWGNVGLSNDEARALEQEQLDSLAGSVQLSADKDDEEGSGHPLRLEINSRQTEEELAEELGLGYFRLFVSDHLRPRDEEVDSFVEFVDELPPGTWLHFHCRGGKGRTTTFMAMYDMLRNARQVSLEDILGRQMVLEPRYDLLADRSHSPRAVYYRERADFVRRFYDFARQRQPDQSWSNYLAGRQH